MRVKQWMHHPVETIKPRESVEHARALIETHRVNQLPVVVGHELVGIVTDRDLRDAYPSVFEIAAAGDAPRKSLPDPSRIPVESVMATTVLTVGPDDDVTAAAELMRKERVGALPVLDGGRLVGILTRSDLLAAFIDICGPDGDTPGSRAGTKRASKKA